MHTSEFRSSSGFLFSFFPLFSAYILGCICMGGVDCMVGVMDRE
jgi:hypothetical protein